MSIKKRGFLAAALGFAAMAAMHPTVDIPTSGRSVYHSVKPPLTPKQKKARARAKAARKARKRNR